MKKIIPSIMVFITICIGVSAQKIHNINPEKFLCNKYWIVPKDTNKDESAQIMFKSDNTYILSIALKNKKISSDLMCYGKWEINGEYITITIECNGKKINQNIKIILLDDISLIVSYQNTLSFFMHPNNKQYADK